MAKVKWVGSAALGFSALLGDKPLQPLGTLHKRKQCATSDHCECHRHRKRWQPVAILDDVGQR